MRSKKLRSAALVLTCVFPAAAGGEEVITRPHIEQGVDARPVSLFGQTYVNHGLVGAGSVPAETVDFLGDTLGSFSSLKIAPGSWRRAGDHYEGILWTLPDRGRNDPDANLFFDYAARLNRFLIRFTPADGSIALIPDGGLELRDFNGQPFTGADPDKGTLVQRGITLPAPAKGVGRGKVSLDAEALQFTADGSFYIADEYTANVYYFDSLGHLAGIIQPPVAIAPQRDGQTYFGSLKAPDSGRRNNQGPEGMSLSPDGRTLFVALQSALIQDSAAGNAAGRINTRVLTYDLTDTPAPALPSGHYVVQLPAFDSAGEGGAPDRTAAQSEIRALDSQRFLMLSRDGAGVGAANDSPMVYKSILLVDTAKASNLASTEFENSTVSLLRDPGSTVLRPEIIPADKAELVNMLNPAQLARFGLKVDDLSEKWEGMDLVPTLEPDRPDDYFLLIGNDNDFITRNCRMSGQNCDSETDNDNRILIYRVKLPGLAR